MITYQLEWRTTQRPDWMPYGQPADSLKTLTNAAAHSTRVGGEEFRVVGLSTEAQPDGTIVRRELSPDELAAAIRGEQVEPKLVKAVVVVWDDTANREAVYVEGKLLAASDLARDDGIDAGGLARIGDGQPITIRAVSLDREIKNWPAELASLELD